MSVLARLGLGRVMSVVWLSAIAAAGPAAAHSGDGSGGAGYSAPEVTGLSCDKADNAGCPRGAEVRLKGENLTTTSSVVFLGRRGTTDDLIASPVTTAQHRVVVNVPAQARSGRVRAVTGAESADGPRLKVSTEQVRPASGPGSGVFPIRAKYDYGTATNGFGGGRGHQGQDIFAKCGKKLVSALTGTVTLAKYQERAGNYAVIKAADGTSQVYMHMQSPALVSPGDSVSAGQPIGLVGDTGRATGCHLHFELWTAPGWYEGGEAIDPLPALKAWGATR